LKSVSIALPHTDIIHVKKTSICVALLTNPVTFSHMGNPNIFVEVELIFMIAILNPNEQIDTLKKLLEILQNDKVASEFKDAKDNDLYAIAKKYLN
jgi:PTS system galactitol-specific IIA component